MTSRPNTAKIVLIAGAVLLGVGTILAIGVLAIFSLKPRTDTSIQGQSLAVFMPEQPKATKLIGEGYDPKANCFDKCGYLYRRYSYSDSQLICQNLFAALSFDSRFTITSPATKQPSVEWCEAYLKKSFSESAYLTFEVNAAVTLENGRRDDSRRIASAVVTPAKKTIEYRVSQEIGGAKFAR